MSQLLVTIPNEITVVRVPAVTATLPTSLEIERIVDFPGKKEVVVFVKGFGRIPLDDLSGDNYDVPAEWTNSDVVSAVTNYFNNLDTTL